MRTKDRFEAITSWFSQNMPHARTELEYTSVWSLLVAVMLSAQCTDKRVNMVTPELMQEYPTPERMAKASPNEVLSYIKSISYPNTKADHLFRTACQITNRHKGIVPDNRKELEELPGVGRKTANVILSIAFDQPAMPVDTHVFRVAKRLGLSNGNNPIEVEIDLTNGFNKELLTRAHHWLILHGRYVCKAKNPLCSTCPIALCCKFFNAKK